MKENMNRWRTLTAMFALLLVGTPAMAVDCDERDNDADCATLTKEMREILEPVRDNDERGDGSDGDGGGDDDDPPGRCEREFIADNDDERGSNIDC